MVTILAFEGPDKVGKSTLIQHLNRRTNYRYFCIDRFLGSAWVYDAITGRRSRNQALADAEADLAATAHMRVITVLIRCDTNILTERIRQEDEEPADRLAKLERMIQLYDDYVKATRLPCVVLDTTHKTIQETVTELMEKLQAYE